MSSLPWRVANITVGYGSPATGSTPPCSADSRTARSCSSARGRASLLASSPVGSITSTSPVARTSECTPTASAPISTKSTPHAASSPSSAAGSSAPSATHARLHLSHRVIERRRALHPLLRAHHQLIDQRTPVAAPGQRLDAHPHPVAEAIHQVFRLPQRRRDLARLHPRDIRLAGRGTQRQRPLTQPALAQPPH